MEEKYSDRRRSYRRSLAVLRLSCGADPEADFVLGATVQAYNLTFDLAWKVMKDIAVQEYGVTDFATGSPRETLRTAFRLGIISDDRWMTMLQVRNTLIHDYDGAAARKYFTAITTEFYALFMQLEAWLHAMASEE